MSKNKRNRYHKTLSKNVPSPVADESEAAGSVQSDSAKGNSLVSYLKSHLWLVAAICFLTLGALGAGLKYLDEDAKREIARRNQKGNLNNSQEESFLNKVNPFLPAPSPSSTPQLAKEYIYAGQRLLAVEDTHANAAAPSDLAIWRPSSGTWWVMAGSGTQQVSQSWGTAGDKPVAGDYDGDGKTDFAVYRKISAQTSQWWILRSSDATYTQVNFGLYDDQPVSGDFDGDGKTDVAVFRNSNTTWYISYSSTGATVSGAFGSSGDIPAPADFDGDGRFEPAVFRESNASFYYLRSTDLQSVTVPYGASGDKPLPADYDGDGRADIAFWRSSNATWYFKYSADGSTANVQFGIGTDTPVQNDYDGDGKVDIAVWRGVASTSPGGDVGKWYIRNSSNPTPPRVETWGQAGDIPVPAFYKR